MNKKQVLVIEDEEDIQELVRYNLEKEGYEVQRALSGERGLAKARTDKPDLILLDLMLPGMDGLSVCRALKNDPNTQGIAVVMLTAKGEESDIVVGLELGADDYITKPFSPKVVVARVRAVLRRMEEAEDHPEAKEKVITTKDITIHPGRHEVTIHGKPVELTAMEFSLLYLLARRPGWVFTRQQILDGVRGHDYVATERAVDVQVVGLRKKLGSVGKQIQTVRGVGYRFKE